MKLSSSPHQPITAWLTISMLLLALIALNTYISRVTTSKLDTLHTSIAQTARVEAALEQLHLHVLVAESGQRGYLLTRNLSYLNHFEKATANIQQSLKDTQTLKQHIPSQAGKLDELTTLINVKVAELSSTIALARNNNFDDAISIVETNQGKLYYENINAIFVTIKGFTNQLDKQQSAELQEVIQESQWNLFVFFMISVVLVTCVYFLARTNIRSQQARELEMEAQNEHLQLAVEARTKELSLFSDELSRSNRELEDFAFVASHDLQEPLRKIMTFGDRLDTQSDNLSERQRDFLQRMRGAASRMSVLISDLLEFSRITTRGKAFQEVDLNDVVQNCIDDMNILVEETGVIVDIASLPVIKADPTQMQQLFFNLIANAIKFSQHQQTPKVCVDVKSIEQPTSVEVEGLGDWVCFSISDNGIGFEQEYAEQIFAPFQRLHSRDKYKGTGIGLAICRRIVERHNGIVQAQGETNKGATFNVMLPLNNYLISIKQ